MVNCDKILRLFVEKIAKSYFTTSELELAFRKGGRLTMILVDGKEEGVSVAEKEDNTPMGQRIAKHLGITLLEGDKDVKRHSQFRKYDSRGWLPKGQLKLLHLDRIPFPKERVDDSEIDHLLEGKKMVYLKVKQIMWDQGFRYQDQTHDAHILDRKFLKVTDGAGLISPSFKKQSVAWMKANKRKYGIDHSIIRKCEKTKQMSFRAALPGSGQIKAMMQIASWLPDDFILIHRQNVKKEWKVSKDVPFRFWWDAYEGKPISRTNMQFIVAHRFLFPDSLIFRALEKMKARHLELLEEKGFVDDREELLTSIFGDDSEEYGLQRSFSSFARLAPTEISEYGFNPLEFPVVCTRAATASISKWCNLTDASLRIEIPGSVHYQILSEFILLLADPDAERVKDVNGIRFHKDLKVAYVMDDNYLNVITDSGGADMDDYWDSRCVKWNETTTMIISVRAPTKPGEFNVHQLEGDAPVAKEEIETLSQEDKDAIKKELPHRAHLQPMIENMKVDVMERTKPQELYTWGRVKEQIGMDSMSPGFAVNMLAAVWFWNPKEVPPCGMDFIVDSMTQEGLKYGKEGLKQINETVRFWFLDQFTEHLSNKDNDLRKCKFDTGFLFRKGITELLFDPEGLDLEAQFNKIRWNNRPEDWYSILLEEVNRRVGAFKMFLREWIVEKSNALPKRFLGGIEDIAVNAKTTKFTDLYSFYSACYLSSRSNLPVKYLREAMEAEGLEFFSPFNLTKENRKGLDVSKVVEFYFTDKGYKNFRWTPAKINDGKFTHDGFRDEASKVKRTGCQLISKELVGSDADFLMSAVKLSLESYDSKDENGRRYEEYLLEEENWDLFLVWTLVNWEEKGTSGSLEKMVELAGRPLTEQEVQGCEKIIAIAKEMEKTVAPIVPPSPAPVTMKSYTFTFSTVDLQTNLWRSHTRKVTTESRKVLLEKAKEALGWIGSRNDRFVSVTNAEGKKMEVVELIKKLS